MPLPPNDPRIRLVKTSFVIYEYPDLEKATQFLLDFGLTIAEDRCCSNSSKQLQKETFFQGYGPDPFIYLARQSSDNTTPKFCGAAYLVESRVELEKALRKPGAISGGIEVLNAPGGGEIVTLQDPAGHFVHLVHGVKEKERFAGEWGMGLKELVINYEERKPRKGVFQRFEKGPVPVNIVILFVEV